MGTQECGMCGKQEPHPSVIGHKIGVCPECAKEDQYEREKYTCPKCYSDEDYKVNEKLTGMICYNCGYEAEGLV